MFEVSNLYLLFILPLVGAVLAGLLPGVVSRALSMLVMLATLAISVMIFIGFDGSNTEAYRFFLPWIGEYGINLHFAVDGLNVYLMLLTTLLFPVVLLCCWSTPACSRSLFLALLLFLETGLLGTFLSQNLMVFFVFWEAVLIPMFIIILCFGGEKAKQAAQAFFIYTLAGSVLLLAAVLVLGYASWQQTGAWNFEIATLLGLHLDWNTQLFVFAAVLLACAIKCPLFPFHSWLPLAYAEAPPAGTALMAGALSKMGAFALIKLAVPLSPLVASEAAPGLIALAVASILYGAVLALRQEDVKLLVAYSSLSHMGYIVLGIFSFYETALHGALFQTFSHGLAVGGLFLLLGLLEERLGAEYKQVTSLSNIAPRLAVVIMLFVLTSVALPLTSGFTGEFMILLGAFQKAYAVWQAKAGAVSLVAVLLACLGMVLGAGYMLRFARQLLYGPAPAGTELNDLNVREALAFVPLLLLIIWIGVAPMTFMTKVQPAVSEVANMVSSEVSRGVDASSFAVTVDGGSHGH